MAAASRPSFADFVGFVAYSFVVEGGRLNMAELRKAARLLSSDSVAIQPAKPRPERPPMLEDQAAPLDYAPLLMTNVEAPDLEAVGS
jgi:hypothetical protein